MNIILLNFILFFTYNLSSSATLQLQTIEVMMEVISGVLRWAVVLSPYAFLAVSRRIVFKKPELTHTL